MCPSMGQSCTPLTGLGWGMASRRAPLCAALCVAVSSLATPSAAADPPQFPDLGGYTDVIPGDYLTFSAYSTTGVQFVTPGSYRCRMSYVSKAVVTSIN